jgi:hypothetical protein
MNKSRIFKVICIVIVVLILIIININVNLYKSEMGSNQSGISVKSNFENQPGNYNIIFEHDGKEIYDHRVMSDNDQEPIDFIVKIENYKYKGNYYMPLYKKFTMEYKCEFYTEDNVDGIKSIEGSIEGVVEAKITGLASKKTGKRLVELNALESMKKYVLDTAIKK